MLYGRLVHVGGSFNRFADFGAVICTKMRLVARLCPDLLCNLLSLYEMTKSKSMARLHEGAHIGHLSLASLRGRLIEYQLRLGKGRECHLCQVAGNTVRSHVACEFP